MRTAIAHPRTRRFGLSLAVVLLVLGSATPAEAILGLPIEVQGGKVVVKRTVKPTGSTTSTTTLTAPARVHPATGRGLLGPNTNTPAQATGTRTSTTPATAATTPTAATVPPLFGPSTTTTPVRAPTRASSTHKSKLSGAAIAAAVLAALIALGCLAWGVARLLAFEPRRSLSMRHAMAEAGFRASATWAEFSDWARLGR